MLPFEPESINKLKQRYTKALEKIWLAEEGMEDTPSKHRKHVFDFDTGLRLIISRDILVPDKGPEIHISASWFSSPERKFFSLEELYSHIVEQFNNIGGNGHLKLVGVSDKGIPHWIVEKVN